MKVLVVTFAVVVATVPSPVRGDAPVVIRPSDSEIDLNNAIGVLADPAGKLTYEQVSADAFAARFSPAAGRVAFGDSSRVWWVRARIKNGAPAPAQYYVLIEWRNLDRVTARIPTARGVTTKHTGWLVPLAERDVYAPFLAFAIKFLPREEKTVYFRIESPQEIFLPFTAWPERTLFRRILVEALFTGIYFGILIALGIYNLVLFLQLRQRYLLLYVVYIAVYTAWWFVHGGYFGVSRTLLSLGAALPMTLSALYLFFRVWFGRSFLGTREVAPRWDLLLKVFQYGVIPLGCLTSFFVPGLGEGIVQTPANVALFVVALLCVRRGVRQARVYAVAAGMVAFGVVASLLAFNGVVDVPIPLMGLPILFATLVELVVLSLALSDHVRTVEAERRQALERIQADRLQMVRSLVAGVAHELNTPVGSLRSGIEALESAGAALDASRKQEHRKKLERLKKALPALSRTTKAALDRIGVVLASLQTYSRLDESEVKEVDLHEGLDSALVLLGRELGDRISIERSYGEIPAIVCRPAEINQVVMAVLKNSIEAIAEQGTIRIVTAAAGAGVRITIHDDGRGIAQEDLSQLFNPRFSRKGARVRMGLGLPTSLSIVEAHGGQMTIESTPDAGTTVIIELPARAATL